jgi:IclR family pca regulon transcriptional regulator
MSDPVHAEGSFVRSLERGLAVIRALSAPEDMSLSDVARAVGLSRAAARRSLFTLEELGYVRRSGGRFALTPRVLELGYAYLSSVSLPELAQPHLERLVQELHESSSVSVLDGDDIVYVARVPTRRIMSVTISVGTRFPAYATSMGRILLASLPADDLDAALARIRPRRITPSTITTREQLASELERVRRQGWALVDQELEEGLRSIAAPIRGRSNAVVAAVNLSVHASRATVTEMQDRLLPSLLETASAIGRELRTSRVAAA